MLDTLKESENIEDFEKRLNDPDVGVVNLDLNADDEVDYVGVFEEAEGNARVLILRVPIAEGESQDVGSIQLEKIGEEVTLQIVGDPAIYGPDYIVEPNEPETAWLPVQPAIEPIVIASADESWLPTRSYDDESATYDMAAVIIIRSWPAVRVVFVPGYSPWRSPYRWRRYPSYYRARRPVARSHYRHRTAHHRKHHHRAKAHNSARASNLYGKNKVSSPKVNKANTAARTQTTPAQKQGVANTPNKQPSRSQTAPSQQRKPSSPSRAGPGGSKGPSGGKAGGQRKR